MTKVVKPEVLYAGLRADRGKSSLDVLDGSLYRDRLLYSSSPLAVFYLVFPRAVGENMIGLELIFLPDLLE